MRKEFKYFSLNGFQFRTSTPLPQNMNDFANSIEKAIVLNVIHDYLNFINEDYGRQKELAAYILKGGGVCANFAESKKKEG